METKKTDELNYEKANEILRYCAETGVLERKLKFGRWKTCGHRPISNGRGQVSIDGKLYFTHRLIWLLVNGEWPEHEIDHIDRNPMNNRIENLRAANRTENLHNRGMNKNNSSGYPGACFHKQHNKYMARIYVNSKQIFLGYFNTAEEAFLAYQLAKIQCHPTSPIAQQYLCELTLAG